jgi:hypothetical protein
MPHNTAPDRVNNVLKFLGATNLMLPAESFMSDLAALVTWHIQRNKIQIQIQNFCKENNVTIIKHQTPE